MSIAPAFSSLSWTFYILSKSCLVALAVPVEVEHFDNTALHSDLPPGVNLQEVALDLDLLQVHHRGESSDVIFPAASSVQ